MSRLGGFEATPEEEESIVQILNGMGYKEEALLCCAAPEGWLSAVQKDVKELGQEEFMKSLPAGTGPRQKATFSRFLKSLEAEEPKAFATPDTDRVAPEVVKIPVSDSKVADGEPYYVWVHNVTPNNQDKYTLTLRVVHENRFMEYSLESCQIAKVFLPATGWQIVFVSKPFEFSDNEHLPPKDLQLTRVLAATDRDIVSGANIYATTRRKGPISFDVHIGPAMPALEKSSCLIHFVDGGKDTDYYLHHLMPAETPSDDNKLTFTMTEKHCHVVAPSEKSEISVKTSFWDGVSKRRHYGHEVKFSAKECSDQHVYIGCHMYDTFHRMGSFFEEHLKFDAIQDLPVWPSSEPGDMPHIFLHNLSPTDEKFSLNVSVTAKGRKVGSYKLETSGPTELRLPDLASLDVEIQESTTGATGNVKVEASQLRGAPGSNVYLWCELDRVSWNAQEKQTLENTKKYMCCVFLLPIFLLIALCNWLAAKKSKDNRPPLIACQPVVGPPSRGNQSSSATKWHFGKGEGTAFVQRKTTEGIAEVQGFTLVCGESVTIPSSTKSQFKVSSWGMEMETEDRSKPNYMRPDLKETVLDFDVDESAKYRNTHSYVIIRNGEMKVEAGSSLEPIPVWDATKAPEVHMEDLENPSPSNKPAMPGVVEGP